MKAFRNVAGNVVEIEVDIDLNGDPILPPDTTTDVRPDAQEGHYVTVVGKEWVQIPVPQAFVSFETLQAKAQARVKAYRDWFLEQPVSHEGVMFDGDETARARLTQALTVNSANGYLPPVWVTYDNATFPVPDVAALIALVNSVQVAFANRFFEMSVLRSQVAGATTEEELAAVEIPSVPQNGFAG